MLPRPASSPPRHDSSFDLAHGLEVTEEDDTLFQLWDLSRD
jgi:hypothetical protein